MLPNIIKKIKPFEKDLILGLIIVLVAIISFGLGRLSKLKENKVPITIENISASMGGVVAQQDFQKDLPYDLSQQEGESLGKSGLLVASKNGTKYHYPWCSGAQRIKDSNKIWFNSKEEAEKAGYAPASNCKGLE